MSSLSLAASDPEWLPSTIVQSSAALVAVVGGLLVARLVGMAAERRGIVQQIEETEDRLKSAGAHHKDLVTRRAGWDLGDFISSAATYYFSEGAESPEELAAAISDVASAQERIQFAKTFFAWLGDNEGRIRKAHDEGAESVDALRQAGIDIHPIYEPIAEELLHKLKPRSSHPFGFEIPVLPVNFSTDEAGRTVTLQRWDSLLRDIEIAQRQMWDLERERDLLHARLQSLSPEGVTGTLLALGLVVMAGIAFPIVVMASKLPELNAWWRWTMVAAFLLSVAGVGAYIFSLARSLTTQDEPPPRTDDSTEARADPVG
jgi:hypothetical protein